jgi:hypothetical protein
VLIGAHLQIFAGVTSIARRSGVGREARPATSMLILPLDLDDSFRIACGSWRDRQAA